MYKIDFEVKTQFSEKRKRTKVFSVNMKISGENFQTKRIHYSADRIIFILLFFLKEKPSFFIKRIQLECFLYQLSQN